jgi:uncharacterized membrane protein YfcA
MTELLFYALLVGTGLVAGFVNTIAGGGSNLTIPALMLMGMPADVANATNRVAVFLQSGVGTATFRSRGRLDSPDLGPILTLTLAGGAAGALLAALLPNTWLKPLLLLAMVGMALVILVRPDTVIRPEGTPIRRVAASRESWAGLLLAGVYGGFVQAGVGFILIGAIAGSLRYDIVRTNALKNLCVLAFTGVALAIFIAHGLVEWLPGLILAMGSMAGAHASARFALHAGPRTIKWLLFLMTLVAAGAALLYA